MSSKEWVNLIHDKFGCSRTCAKDMYHAMITVFGMWKFWRYYFK